jgi:isobutyryl-CoA mutase
MSEFQLKNKVKIVTAASLFDGHDAAINIMRRIIQSKGVEVVHLGHNRSVSDIVNTAIQEDANAIAITSYQGGHCEFFKYMYDLLQEQNCGHIKLFGGGGGTILPTEIKELMDYGITRIYSPDDGRAMGLEGMIIDLISKCDYPTGTPETYSDYTTKEAFQKAFETCDGKFLAKLISTAENFPECLESDLRKFFPPTKTIGHAPLSLPTPVLGITGTGGAGKSSMIDEIVRRFLLEYDDKKIAILSVDPSKRKTGGALLGDRIRMNSINNDRVFMRSLATRQSNLALSKYVNEAVEILKLANFDLIILETSGIGQSDTEIVDHSDVSMYIMTPEFGAASQLEKIDMLDFADIVAINKFDKRGALDALRDVKKAYQRNHNLWDVDPALMPIYGTIASQFNDPGTNELFVNLMRVIGERYNEKYG